MEIKKIKGLIINYEWIVDEPSPLYPQFILDCLYLLFLYETGGNEEFLNSESAKSFRPDIEELKEEIIACRKKSQPSPLLLDKVEALEKLVSFLEKEPEYIPNDSLSKRLQSLKRK